MNSDRPVKQRADIALVERGLVESRSKAQALILAGQVFSDEQRIDKPGQVIRNEQPLNVRGGERYVSRGGDKLAGALADLPLKMEPWVCVDVGASTGGFTDCLLQEGVSKVYAVDVGQGQLAHKLRQDPRVVVREGVNARHLRHSDFEEAIDLVVVDASFIGIGKLLPAITNFLKPTGLLLAMIKPQFEAGETEARKARGVIRDETVRQAVLEQVRQQIREAGFAIAAECDSRLRGPKGNLEHFVLCSRSAVDRQ
ncbi:MAG TPA: TlyA family RNA methyltransferase [Polyangiaceae bacterium]|nr:TlyA family RNA methyltransferase [Polyangiaceae bacterium]